MGLRETFFRFFGTNTFAGVTLRNWLRILRDNHFSIDAPFWPRAALITLAAFPNSLAALADEICFRRAIARTKVEPPLFVLGAWRSGTTHLHNLLAVDKRFGYSNLYQVTCPLTFLTSERANAWLIDLVAPKQRPQDAVKIGVNEPQEEDFAMCSLGGQANLMSWAFPRNAAFYQRYMTLDELSADELARWKSCYELFLKKLTYKYGRPLVLKSPANTGRIKTLLELFPDARFIHIHRNPYDIYRSNTHTLHTAGPWWQLQRIDYGDSDAIHTYVTETIKTLYDGYFAQCSLIPPGRLHQIAFCDLERDPVGEIRKAYEALELPDFRVVEQPLRTYLNSLADYKKNVFGELPDHTRNQVHCRWRQYFAEWRYAA
jgi:omega-hydroxy-beta-dihydromenaquinone-9 sulfotransferase